MDYRLNLICGTDMLIPECNLVAHQPRIKEISFIGESDFFIGAQTLCLHKTMFIEDKTILDSINNFQIFMTIMLQDETKDKKANILNVLNLLFPSYKVNVTPNSLLFIKEGVPPIIVDGNNIESFNDNQLTKYRSKNVGFIFQFYNLIPNLTALENVELMKDIVDVDIDGMKVLASVGLDRHANQFPSQLSGGEQQRVSIARAVAKKPSFFEKTATTSPALNSCGSESISLAQIHGLNRLIFETMECLT